MSWVTLNPAPEIQGIVCMQVVNSRSFALPGGNAGELATTFLLPLADFFNHGGETADLLLSGRSSRTANVG